MTWGSEEARRLGDTLREERLRRGLTQERLAYAAGTTKNSIQPLEAGKASGRRNEEGPSNPRIATLVGIAEALETSVAEILEGAGI